MSKSPPDLLISASIGGYGYCTEYRVEQFLRDANLMENGGGTLEAHQKKITRDLLNG